VVKAVIRKVEPGRWLLYPHPQRAGIQFYETGEQAWAEVVRLVELWPRCASWDDFVDDIPDGW